MRLRLRVAASLPSSTADRNQFRIGTVSIEDMNAALNAHQLWMNGVGEAHQSRGFIVEYSLRENRNGNRESCAPAALLKPPRLSQKI